MWRSFTSIIDIFHLSLGREINIASSVDLWRALRILEFIFVVHSPGHPKGLLCDNWEKSHIHAVYKKKRFLIFVCLFYWQFRSVSLSEINTLSVQGKIVKYQGGGRKLGHMDSKSSWGIDEKLNVKTLDMLYTCRQVQFHRAAPKHNSS